MGVATQTSIDRIDQFYRIESWSVSWRGDDKHCCWPHKKRISSSMRFWWGRVVIGIVAWLTVSVFGSPTKYMAFVQLTLMEYSACAIAAWSKKYLIKWCNSFPENSFTKLWCWVAVECGMVCARYTWPFCASATCRVSRLQEAHRSQRTMLNGMKKKWAYIEGWQIGCRGAHTWWNLIKSRLSLDGQSVHYCQTSWLIIIFVHISFIDWQNPGAAIRCMY